MVTTVWLQHLCPAHPRVDRTCAQCGVTTPQSFEGSGCTGDIHPEVGWIQA
jgi:hypothetical protein